MSKNTYRASIQFGFSVALALITAIALTPSLAVTKRPKPPDTGTPSGNTTPGTTRPQATCPATNKPLTAIVANQGEDFTLVEHPTWLFYIPYAAQEISLIEFLLLDETQTKTVYHTFVKLNDQPGIIKLQLPPEAGNSLAVNTTYHWRFNLDCEPNPTIVPDLVLQGWIKRIPLESKVAERLESGQFLEYLVYQNQGIWYDAIATLAELHFINPEDSKLTKAWANTLKLLKLEWVFDEPLVTSRLQPLE